MKTCLNFIAGMFVGEHFSGSNVLLEEYFLQRNMFYGNTCFLG